MAHIKFIKPGDKSIKSKKPISLKLRLYIKILTTISVIELCIIVYGVIKYVNK